VKEKSAFYWESKSALGIFYKKSIEVNVFTETNDEKESNESVEEEKEDASNKGRNFYKKSTEVNVLQRKRN
jgi:hypothetical protein